MAAADEDLQKLGNPPIHSGKEDEGSEWSFVMKKLRVSAVRARSSVACRCIRHRDELRYEYDENQSHHHRGWRDSGQETLPRLGDEREGASVGRDQRNHRHERSIGMAGLFTRYAPNTAPRVQSLMIAILNVKTMASELTDHEIALDEWQENIRKWESISGDRFNASMKKGLLLDKAPSSV